MISFFTCYENQQGNSIYILSTDEGLFVSPEEIEKLYGINKEKLETVTEELTPYIFYDAIYYPFSDILKIGDNLANSPAYTEIEKLKKFNQVFQREEALNDLLKKDIYKTEKRNYYLKKDNHGNKHTSLDYNKAMKPNQPATFNSKFKKFYDETLKKVIITWATANQDKNAGSNIIDFSEETGIDEQTKTTFIELYYNGEIGSHIRPKKITNKALIIKLEGAPKEKIISTVQRYEK